MKLFGRGKRAYDEGLSVGLEFGILVERERIFKVLKEQAEVTGYVEIEIEKLISLLS